MIVRGIVDSKNGSYINSLGGIDEGSLGYSQFRTSKEQTKETKETKKNPPNKKKERRPSALKSKPARACNFPRPHPCRTPLLPLLPSLFHFTSPFSTSICVTHFSQVPSWRNCHTLSSLSSPIGPGNCAFFLHIVPLSWRDRRSSMKVRLLSL